MPWVGGGALVHKWDGTQRRGGCSFLGLPWKPSSAGAKAEPVGASWSGAEKP